MPSAASPVQLKPKTVQAFRAYIRAAEEDMEQTLQGDGPFLWSDLNPVRAQLVHRGRVAAEFSSGEGPTQVPGGLIHDWIGAVFIPDTTLADTLAVIQDYDNHKTIYKPEVIDSMLVSRHGNDFKIKLRLLKKKIITVVLDTYHDVDYVLLDRSRGLCQSRTTRISEVENAGLSNEEVLPPDTGHGFLWRLDSYWRFEEKKDGVWVECRAISLTRDVPFGLKWIIEPIIRTLPRESLINTLEATRVALRHRI